MNRKTKDFANHVKIGAAVLLLLGGWLLFSALAFPYGVSAAAVSNAIIGSLVLMLAVVALRAPIDASPLCWIIAALGIWIFVAPFVLGYGEIILVMGNNLWVGLSLTLVSAFTAGEAMQLNQPLDARS